MRNFGQTCPTPARIDALYTHSSYPAAPSGILYAAHPQAPSFDASGYGARIRLRVKPSQNGDYTFYLSSGGPSELHLIDATRLNDNSTKIAEILPTQQGLSAGEWETYGTQRSEQIKLTANEVIELDLRYVSTQSQQHVEIAWSGPDINGIQKLRRSDLAKRAPSTAKHNRSRNCCVTTTTAQIKPAHSGPITPL